MDDVWSAFIAAVYLADDVPVDNRQAMLKCGYMYRTQ